MFFGRGGLVRTAGAGSNAGTTKGPHICGPERDWEMLRMDPELGGKSFITSHPGYHDGPKETILSPARLSGI